MEWVLNGEDFADIFEGMTVTLMSGRSLRRELSLLRAALRPDAAARDAIRFPLPGQELAESSWALQALLPATPPETRAELAHVLRPLPAFQRAQVYFLARYARETIAAHSAQPLWLVPALYSLRLEMLVQNRLYPAQVRSAAARPWLVPRD